MLKAGAAWCDITPDEEMLAYLNSQERTKYDGVHEHMRFRCIAVNDGKNTAILSGYDMVLAPFCDRMTEALQEKYGIRPELCVFASTHNHEGYELKLREGNDYHVYKRGEPTDALCTYSEWVFDRVFDCIGRAIDSMVPARVGYKKGSSYVNACRDFETPIGPMQANNFHGPSDHELLVIRFDDLDGNTIGMFVNHATHSNAMVWNVTDGSYAMINNDFGGGVSRFVEKANKEQFPVVWAIGAAGDQNPIVRSVWRIPEYDEEGNMKINQHVFNYKDNLLQLQGITSTQGMEVLELSAAIDNFTDKADFDGAEEVIPVPAKVSYRELGLYTDLPGRDSYDNVVNKIQCGDRPEPVPKGEDLQMRFRIFRFSRDISFAQVNCEAYTNLGIMAKSIIPTPATAFCTLTFGHCGYIPDAEGQYYNGYGTSASYAWSGEIVNETFRKAYTDLTYKLF